MDVFSQKKFLTRIILFLVMLNLISVSFFVWKSIYNEPLLFPKNENYKNVSRILKKELNLNEKQVSKLIQIREHYYLKEIDSCVRRNWEILLELLGDENKSIKSEEFLNGYGYDFRFLNNIRKEGEKVYFALYNVGIRQIDSKNYELINFETNE